MMVIEEKTHTLLQKTCRRVLEKTLRDEFACAALNAFNFNGYSPQETAKYAYDVADALLEEKKRRDKE